MRRYAPDITKQAQSNVDLLPQVKEPGRYRDLMRSLGKELGQAALPKLRGTERVLLICTNEDADFLATGILESLEDVGIHVFLACFWHDRAKMGRGEDRAPIVKRFVEPDANADTFLVVKSIVSSSCIVHTNISELVYDLGPKSVLVMAPVMLKGAQERLESEFPQEISRRFDYVWFAEDNTRTDTGEVEPGVGGWVYSLLGLGSEDDKNRYTPELVKQRRRALQR